MPLLQLVLNLPFLIAGFLIKTVFFIRKSEGRAYVKGLAGGIKMCMKGRKYPFKTCNLANYLRIQMELWINTLKRFAA